MKNKTKSQTVSYHHIPSSLQILVDRSRQMEHQARRGYYKTIQYVFIVAGFGLALAATHGAFYPIYHHVTASEFSRRVHADLHTYSESDIPSDAILADSKSLRLLKRFLRRC